MSAQAGARRVRLATPRTASFLAAGVVVLLVILPVLSVLTGQTRKLDASTLKTVSGLLVVVLVVGAVGLVVARHQPGNPIGWLLLAAGWIPSVWLESGPRVTRDPARG